MTGYDDGSDLSNRQIAMPWEARYAHAERITRMPDGDKLEINIPVPWSSKPIGLVFTGWRCIISLIAITSVATMFMYWLS